MSFSDETLMAFADGQLEEPARSAVEQAMLKDPALAARVARHRAMRADVFGAFEPVLREPVPQRLAQAAGSGKVVQLSAVRAARKDTQEKRGWSWPQWGAIAATLVVGVLAGGMGLRGWQADTQLASVDRKDGALMARGKLAAALSQQLASTAQAGQEVTIGVSFVSKEGAYCRSFMLGGTAGLACKEGARWSIPVMAETAPGAAGSYRQAGSEMPAAVLEAIDQRIAGQALDARAERAAARQGWNR
jgi:hypothetical protein